MIINSIVIKEGGKTFNRIESKKPYFGLGYDDDLNVVLMTEYDKSEQYEGALEPNTVTDSLLNGFGADTYPELIAEAEKRGLKFPTDE